ncbi:Putative ribonuclease H protein At1g65750 [Linum grandiflorum]
MCSLVDRWNWTIPLTISLRGGALWEWNYLIHKLTNLPQELITVGPSSIVWPLEASGCFLVNSLRRALTQVKFPGYMNFPHNIIWESSAPTNVQSFCWRVYHGKIATQDKLQRRGFQVANRCALCLVDSESEDHLFLQCDFDMLVWARISSKLSIFGPLHATIRECISAWKGMNYIYEFQTSMKVSLHAIMWFLWLEWNEKIFSDKAKTTEEVVRRIMLNTGNWLTIAGFFSVTKQGRWNQITFDPG